MTRVSNLGYPRLGEQREWKHLIESYWADKISKEELEKEARALRLAFLQKQADAGVDLIQWETSHCMIIS